MRARGGVVANAACGLLLLLEGCASSGGGAQDGAPEAGPEATLEGSSPDAAPEASALDATLDAALDGALPLDSSVDASADASALEASADALPEASRDAGAEGGASTRGAGQPGYVCPPGAQVVIAASDTPAMVTARLNGAAAGDTICISGRHQLTMPVAFKANQHVLGVSGTDARLSGAVTLAGSWHAGATAGTWYYDGPEANRAGQPHQRLDFATGETACHDWSGYQDDVFFDDVRMMRVTRVAELPDSAALPPGQAATPATSGRFFFDYAAHRVWVNRDPTSARVDLAALDNVVTGAANADHVVLENVVLEVGLSTVLSIPGSAQSWTLRDVTVRYAHNVGVNFGAGISDADRMLYERVLVTNNGQYGMNSVGSWITIRDSELSWNNIANYRQRNGAADNCGNYWAAGGAKFNLTAGTSLAAPGFRLVNFDVHDNVGPGFWADVHNRFVVVQGGRYHHNEGPGFYFEISCDAEVSGGEFDHNGRPILNTDLPQVMSAGIFLSDANNAWVHDNRVHDNVQGIILGWLPHGGMLNAAHQCPPASTDTDISSATRGHRIESNDVYLCGATYVGAALPPTRGFDLASRMDSFTGNRYHVPALTGSHWSASTLSSWSAWTGTLGQDTGGSVVAGCSYP